jgi:hypothetical protein
MSTHSLLPEVEMCSVWGTVCTVNVRENSQGEECSVLSAVKRARACLCVCVCVCVCVCGPYLDVLERFFFFPSCLVPRCTRRLLCLLLLTCFLGLGNSNGRLLVALWPVLNRKFASAMLLLLLEENLRSTGAVGDLQV